jgi:hypothetical protein
VWPILAQWWVTPVEDLTESQEEEFEFLLSLAPASYEPGVSVFAPRPPAAVSGRELVCLEFGRDFHEVSGINSQVGIEGGARLLYWYEYNAPWKRLRDRSEWIEMGIGTPQVDASSCGRGPELNRLARYIEMDSGVLPITAEQRALALVVIDPAGDNLLTFEGTR